MSISSFEGALHKTRKNKYFEKIANITVSGIRSLSLQIILNLWKNRARVNSHVSVKVAKLSLVISNICLEYYKFRIRDSYRLVLPYYVDISLAKAKKMVKKYMLKCGVNGIIAQYISQKIALTKSYGRSIGKIIDNSKNAAKQFNINKPPSCSCKFVKMLSSNVGLSLDHCWVKATEVEDPYFLSVFRMSANSIPNPYLATV